MCLCFDLHKNINDQLICISFYLFVNFQYHVIINFTKISFHITLFAVLCIYYIWSMPKDMFWKNIYLFHTKIWCEENLRQKFHVCFSKCSQRPKTPCLAKYLSLELVKYSVACLPALKPKAQSSGGKTSIKLKNGTWPTRRDEASCVSCVFLFSYCFCCVVINSYGDIHKQHETRLERLNSKGTTDTRVWVRL